MSWMEEFEEFDVGAEENEEFAEEAAIENKEAAKEIASVRDRLIEQFLKGEAAEKAISAEAGTDSIGFENIVGVGGPSHKISEGKETDQLAVIVYVAEKYSKDRIDTEALIPESIDGVPTDVVVTGEIIPQRFTGRYRPAQPGVSVGHPSVTAGTLGCLVRRGTSLYMLSNNHVLANADNARAGDPIVQPGVADGGRVPRDNIAKLSEWKRLNFQGGCNYIDAAIAQTSPSLVGCPTKCSYRISSSPIAPRLNLLVKKCGRTTQLTKGRIVDINASIRIRYGSRVALFCNQIASRSLDGSPFTQGGDSGSLVVAQDGNRPVGLHFAGSTSAPWISFHNPIQRVLRDLNVTIVC